MRSGPLWDSHSANSPTLIRYLPSAAGSITSRRKRSSTTLCPSVSSRASRPSGYTSLPTPSPYPGAPAEVATAEDWAFDRHITRGGAFRHDRDLARCARRHGAYEPDLEAIGVGFRLVAPAA